MSPYKGRQWPALQERLGIAGPVIAEWGCDEMYVPDTPEMRDLLCAISREAYGDDEGVVKPEGGRLLTTISTLAGYFAETEDDINDVARLTALAAVLEEIRDSRFDHDDVSPDFFRGMAALARGAVGRMTAS